RARGGGRIHPLKGSEELLVHALAVEQGLRRLLYREAGDSLDRVPVVEQYLDIPFAHPKLLELVEGLAVGERPGEENSVDASLRGAREDVHHEAAVNRLPVQAVRLPVRSCGFLLAQELADLAIDRLGALRRGDQELTRTGRVRGGGTDHPQQLLGDAVD